MADPLETLGVALAADHSAEKQKRGRKGAKAAELVAEGNAPDSTDLAATDATTTDATPSDASAPSDGAEKQSTPPAPGEDRDSVFDRRLDRLARIVEETEFESGTALGDLVECMVDLFKHRPQVWSAMGQDEQRSLVKHVEKVSQQILRKVVLVVAQEDSKTIQGTFLGNFTVKGEAIEAKLKIEGVDGDVLGDVYALAGHKVVIISADEKAFLARRREVATEPDQIPLQFADDKPKATNEIRTPPPVIPDDDSDLAGEDGEGDKGELVEGDEEMLGVFNSDADEWLADEDGGEEGWVLAPTNAKSWPAEQAKEMAEAFNDPNVTAKAIPASE